MARVKNYTLGAGKLFFDRFDEDGNTTGEFYIGNTTSLTYSVDEERQEHFSSDEAARERDASIVTRSDVTVGFTTDDIQPENMAMMMKGTAEVLAVAADPSVVENITVQRGRWYQLGVDAANPTGARLITLTSLTDDAGTPVAVPGGNGGVNYEVDLALGRLYIKEDAPDVADGDILIATFAIAASERTVILSAGEQVTGALRYIADNTTGTNNDVYFPQVEISPDGDYEFKSDDWSEMSFSGDSIKKGDLAKVYVDGRATAA
jgi:hypothetical protein